jgi:lysophospholipase L1-like esterase
MRRLARAGSTAIAAISFSCGKPEPDRMLMDASLLPPAKPPDGVPLTQAPESSFEIPEYVAKALRSPKIVLIGDSIVHYSNELVSRRLAEAINSSADSGAFASAEGVTKGGQLVNGWIGYQFDRLVADKGNNVIVLQGGVNDIGWYGRTGRTRMREEAFQKLMARFEDAIRKAQDNGKVLVLVTVSPWKGQPHWNEVGQENSERLNSWMRMQTSRPGVFVADTYSELVSRCQSEKDMLARGYRGADVQHTNDAGRKLIGEVVARALGFDVALTPPEPSRPCQQ